MMRNYHQLTHVTAIITLFVVLLLSGLATATGRASVTNPLWRLKELPVVEQQIQEIDKSENLTGTISSNLKLVFKVGNEIGNPETLQGILLQETGGGQTEPIGNKDSPVGKRSYGLMQIQVIAARSILERHPELVKRYFPDRKYASLADEEVIALLLTDNEANARIAAYHFKLYLTLSNGNWDKAIAAYNAGIGAVMNIVDYGDVDYVKGVKNKIATTVKSFNIKNRLQLTQRF